MYHKARPLLLFFFTLACFLSGHYGASAQDQSCEIKDRLCILDQLTAESAKIENNAWRDQTYREIAKTYAFEGQFEKAIEIIAKIETPDTKALTIRGIAMEIAPQNFSEEKKKERFTSLRLESEKITHPPSYAIALTYIAMAQAFADDNEGAWKTASDMENSALRNKAYGETAEIQAEKGDYKSAQISIEKIESISYRNKAFSIVSKILADKKLFEEAYSAAKAVTNPYKKAQSIQYILDQQKPRQPDKKLTQTGSDTND